MLRTHNDYTAYGESLAEGAPPLTDTQVRKAARILAGITEPAAA